MSVYRALQATQFLPGLAGAAPYSLSGSSIKFSRIGFIWPLIQFPGYLFYCYINSVDIPVDNVEIKTLLMASSSWLQLIIAVYSIVKDGLCQKNIIEIVRSIDAYDKRSGYTKYGDGMRENERVRLWSYAYSAVIVFLTLGRYFIWRKIRDYAIMDILSVLIDNGIYMFVVLTTLLGLRLRHLNSMVDEARVTIVRENGTVPESLDPVRPEYFRELYTSMVATGERINDHYSDRLFLWSANVMATCLMLIYLVITENASMLLIAATIVHVLTLVLGMLLFCVPCQFVTGQAKNIIAALLEKNIRHTARINRGRREIFTMGLYMALRPLQFSAFGLFSVDFNTTFAIVTTTVTYLILCIQTGGA